MSVLPSLATSSAGECHGLSTRSYLRWLIYGLVLSAILADRDDPGRELVGEGYRPAIDSPRLPAGGGDC
jgi:hypothetical protein